MVSCGRETYSFGPIPYLLNHHSVYPEIKPGDTEVTRLYKGFLIKAGYSKYYQSSKKGTWFTRKINNDS